MRVSLFVTCFDDTIFPDTGRAVVRALIAGEDVGQHLHRDLATKSLVARRPHGCHPSAAEAVQEPIAAVEQPIVAAADHPLRYSTRL